MQVRVQRKTWIEFQEKMQGPSRRQGSSFMLDQKGRQDRLKVTRLYVVGWGPELEINGGEGVVCRKNKTCEKFSDQVSPCPWWEIFKCYTSTFK